MHAIEGNHNVHQFPLTYRGTPVLALLSPIHASPLIRTPLRTRRLYPLPLSIHPATEDTFGHFAERGTYLITPKGSLPELADRNHGQEA